MKRGFLSGHFTGVAVKRLAGGEVERAISTQHEFNGNGDLRRILGDAGIDKVHFPARVIYFGPDETEGSSESEDLVLTWYDSRAKSHERTGRSEHRLYYQASTLLSERPQPGDFLFVARRADGKLLAIVVDGASSRAHQLLWLFGLSEPTSKFEARDELENAGDRLGIVASLVLAEIGIDADVSDESLLDQLLGVFGPSFPSTREFSAFARKLVPEMSAKETPDELLMSWLDQEEIAFRTLEKHIIGSRLQTGFMGVREPDVDEFLSYSLSVQNRRKARAGAALENHLEELFCRTAIGYQRGARTERKNRPDFLFPNEVCYHSGHFDPSKLTMLAAKTTAKDRWRQITKEADRIDLKHLATLEPAISEAQTDQMRDSGVQLVVPSSIHGRYTKRQCGWILSVADFIAYVRERERPG